MCAVLFFFFLCIFCFFFNDTATTEIYTLSLHDALPILPEYADKVGAFEGAGYVAKGVYRPFEDCTMRSITVDNFCPVCKRVIQNMINFYSE